MNISEFEQTIRIIFEHNILEGFPDEWGITTRGREQISRIGYATNLTLDTAVAAREAGVDMLVTHHDAWPFLTGMKEACRSILQDANISHFFVHLPLDDADFGTNTSLANCLGGNIVDRTHLHKDLLYCGRILEFQPSIPFNVLVQRTENVLCETVKFWKNNKGSTSRLCIITGGGSMTTDVEEAVEHQCDAYLTGEKSLYTIEYSRFAGINLIVGSHTFTEIFGVESLVQQIIRLNPLVAAVRVVEEHLE